MKNLMRNLLPQVINFIPQTLNQRIEKKNHFPSINNAFANIHFPKDKDTEIKIWVSGMSAKARGYDDALLNGFDAEFSMPDKLISLSIEADSVLCY